MSSIRLIVFICSLVKDNSATETYRLTCPFCYETCFHNIFIFPYIYFNVNICGRVFFFTKQFIFFKKKKKNCDPGVIGTAFTVTHSIIMAECTRAASSCRMCL